MNMGLLDLKDIFENIYSYHRDFFDYEILPHQRLGSCSKTQY